jgi:hypothetical protein
MSAATASAGLLSIGNEPQRSHEPCGARLFETARTAEHSLQSWTRRRRSALAMTETELKVIAALAMIGLSSRLVHG